MLRFTVDSPCRASAVRSSCLLAIDHRQFKTHSRREPGLDESSFVAFAEFLDRFLGGDVHKAPELTVGINGNTVFVFKIVEVNTIKQLLHQLEIKIKIVG